MSQIPGPEYLAWQANTGSPLEHINTPQGPPQKGHLGVQARTEEELLVWCNYRIVRHWGLSMSYLKPINGEFISETK
ncbi:hypothetical protein SLEP1_g48643 [Rubroshorea leprosula]|uniref:Uncharacterized protein n=1 Tax=Rubroshorea leprosula TaxID=152421 RepID=A0AAV5LW74_9ROSI|nr:hypothetical protein SLEP1_g48643 [Rubroshorea leprosula]